MGWRTDPRTGERMWVPGAGESPEPGLDAGYPWEEDITVPPAVRDLPGPLPPPELRVEAPPPPAPEAEPGAPAPEPTVEAPPPWEDITIPYLGQVSPETGIYEPEETELGAWLEETITGRARGEGIAQLTPEKIEEFRPFIEQIMKPRYEQQMRDLSEKWRAAGRAIDTEKLESVGRLSIQYNAEVVGKMIGMAKDEVDRTNFEMGRAIGQGLTLAQMEQADQHLVAGQKFQLNMYKRQIRDQAIAGLEDLKIKDYYTRLARAWDLEDWDAYRDLAVELADAGQPDLADYLLSLVEAVIPVLPELLEV